MTTAPKSTASSRRAPPNPAKEEPTNEKNLVVYEYDPARPLRPEQIAELTELAARPAAEIDVSDIPPLDDTFWKNAAPNPFFRPIKTQLTVRLDADVLAWLKSGGRGYQTKLNMILRRAMTADRGERRADGGGRRLKKTSSGSQG